LGRRVSRVVKVSKDLMAHKELLGNRALKELLVRRVSKVFKVSKDLTVPKVLKVQLDNRVFKVFKDL
jgi:hypothetical protein